MPAWSHKLFAGWLLLQMSNKFFVCSDFVYLHLKELWMNNAPPKGNLSPDPRVALPCLE